MEVSAKSINPLVLLQALILGILFIFVSHTLWVLAMELFLLLLTHYVLRVHITRGEGIGLVVGPVLWTALAYVNHQHGTALSAPQDGLRFLAALWLSILIIHMTSPSMMMHHLERRFKQWFGRRTIIGQVALMALLVMRYLPQLWITAKRVNADVRMRLQLVGGSGRWKDKIRFLTPLIMISIMHSDRIAEAIWARGWRPGQMPVVAPWTKRDTVITVTLWTIFLISWKALI